MEDNSKVKGRLNSLTESDYLFTCPIVKGEILFGIGSLPEGKRRRDLEQKANELFAVFLSGFRKGKTRRSLLIWYYFPTENQTLSKN